MSEASDNALVSAIKKSPPIMVGVVAILLVVPIVIGVLGPYFTNVIERDVQKLESKISTLSGANDALQKTISTLAGRIGILEKERTDLKHQIALLTQEKDTEIKLLQSRVKELEILIQIKEKKIIQLEKSVNS